MFQPSLSLALQDTGVGSIWSPYDEFKICCDEGNIGTSGTLLDTTMDVGDLKAEFEEETHMVTGIPPRGFYINQ
jgi:hypothetical protein